WETAVVVDPRTLESLGKDGRRLRRGTRRLKGALCVTLAGAVVFGARLEASSRRLGETEQGLRECRKSFTRSSGVLSALARSQEKILLATEQAPSVGTKSWGRRFTVTKYTPRSAARTAAATAGRTAGSASRSAALVGPTPCSRNSTTWSSVARPPRLSVSRTSSRTTRSKPAAARMPRTRSGSAKEKGPGASGAGGGGSLSCCAAAPSGRASHGFSRSACQQMKASRPPGRSAARRFVKAAVGSAKNITPKRE